MRIHPEDSALRLLDVTELKLTAALSALSTLPEQKPLK